MNKFKKKWKNINEKKFNFLFIHIPKTGGLSVQRALYWADIRNGHNTASKIRDKNPEKFHNRYKFAIVRNPWERIYSAYNYLEKGGSTSGDPQLYNKHLRGFRNFNEFVKALKDKKYAERIKNVKHFIPQWKFVCDSKANIIVDCIGRYENLEDDLRTIFNKIGIRFMFLPHLNKSRKKDLTNIYDKETYYIIYEMYKQDIDLFGYE